MRLHDRPDADRASRRPARRRRWRKVATVLIVLLVAFCVATARLLVWPAQGMPTRVNAVVVLGGPGDRLGQGLELARQGRAPFLVVSEGLPFQVPRSVCAPHGVSFQVICFQPEPGNTKGEAEFVGRLARRYHWRSVALVVTPDQDTRARIRFGRCFAGQVYVVTTPLSASSWPEMVAYQWAAMFKAEVLQRAC
jgi:uncharacterized SAM-binding protein YcdF (DUF218 family)